VTKLEVSKQDREAIENSEVLQLLEECLIKMRICIDFLGTQTDVQERKDDETP